MPHFYFDVMDANRRVQDWNGRECTSLAEARRQGYLLLCELAVGKISDGAPCRLGVAVRDEKFCYMVASVTLDKQPSLPDIAECGNQCSLATHH